MQPNPRPPIIAPSDPHQEGQSPPTRSEWVTLERAARARGFVDAEDRPAIARFRARLRQLGVRVNGKGRYAMVCPAEFDAAMDRVTRARVTCVPPPDDEIARAVATHTARRR